MSEKIEMTIDQLMFFGESIAKKAVENILQEVNLITDTIPTKQAYKLYGEGRIKKWVKNGDLKLGCDFFKDGGKTSTIYFSREKLRELSVRTNLNF